MTTGLPAVKSPRALHSQSPAFEAGYAAFMTDVFVHDVMSVRREETEKTRALVLADMYRVVLNKETGLLHQEKRSRSKGERSLGVVGPWRAVKGFPVDSFWATRTELSFAITTAWSLRIEQFVPTPALSYPDGVPARFKENFTNVVRLWEMFVSIAAERRLGGRRIRKVAIHSMVSGLWNFLVDREVLRLCQAFFGRKASLNDYNFTIQRRTELMARALETPNLTPLIGLFLRHHPVLSSGRHSIPLDILATAKESFFAARDDCRPVGGLRRAPQPKPPREPLSPAGWRYLVGATRVGIEHIWRLGVRDTEEGLPSAVRLAPVLNLLARAGDAHPLAFITWAISVVTQLGGVTRPEAKTEQARESLLRFLRLAGREAALAKKKGQLKRFVKGELTLCWDWFKNREGRSGRAKLVEVVLVPKNATWASIVRVQQEWHASRAERERVRLEADRVFFLEHRARQDAICWDSRVGAFEMDGIHVIPLTTGLALREEGEQMAHCVGDYIEECQAGTSRIFHLTREAERATLELTKNQRREWRVSQVFGPSNDEVSKQIAAAARVLAKRYQAAEARRVAFAKPA
jgi:hypothetical protein